MMAMAGTHSTASHMNEKARNFMNVKYSTTPMPYWFRSVGCIFSALLTLCCGFASSACSTASSMDGRLVVVLILRVGVPVRPLVPVLVLPVPVVLAVVAVVGARAVAAVVAVSRVGRAVASVGGLGVHLVCHPPREYPPRDLPP